MSADDQSPAEGGRRSDLAVMDANEFKQKRRLKRILDTHDAVEDRAATAYEQYTRGEISEQAKDIVLLQSVKKLVREIHTLLEDHVRELDDGRQDIYLQGDPADPIGKLDLPNEDRTIWFIGLRDILHADEVYRETWTETEGSRHGPAHEEEYSRVHTVPEEVSWEAFLLAKRFLSEEKDLEIRFEDLDDGLPSWGFFEVPDEQLPDGEEVAASGDD